MNKLLLIPCLCCFAAPGCLETRVIRDNSITKQFMELDGKGNARVTLGDGTAQAKERERERARLIASRKDTYNPNWRPLGDAVVTTNFRVDENQPNAATVSPAATTPPPTTSTLGGMMLPDMSTRQPAK